MNINEKIQMYRKKAGLSQEALAEEIKVSRQAVSKWESGTAQPTLENCKELCRVFQIGMNELYQEDGNSISIPHEHKNKWSIGLWAGLFLMAIISLAFNGYMLFEMNEAKKEIKTLTERIDGAYRQLNQNSKTEIIYSRNDEETELESLDITGTLNEENQVDLALSVRLAKQNEKTQVGCSLKNAGEEYLTETTLQSDYSFLVTATVPLVDEVELECYKIQENEIIHLVSESYAIKKRFSQDVELFIDAASYTKPYENELLLAISPQNQYGAFEKDSKGNTVKKLSISLSLIESGQEIGFWSDEFEEKMNALSQDTMEEALIYNDLIVFAPFQLEQEKYRQCDDICIRLEMMLNDMDKIEKEYQLKDLKLLGE